MKLTYLALAAALLALPLSAHAEGEKRVKPNYDSMTLEQIKDHSAKRHADMKARGDKRHAEMQAFGDKCNANVQNATTKEAALAAKKACKDEMKAKHAERKAKWEKHKAEKAAK